VLRSLALLLFCLRILPFLAYFDRKRDAWPPRPGGRSHIVVPFILARPQGFQASQGRIDVIVFHDSCLASLPVAAAVDVAYCSNIPALLGSNVRLSNGSCDEDPSQPSLPLLLLLPPLFFLAIFLALAQFPIPPAANITPSRLGLGLWV